ncbi:Ig-like domain-containing protein [Natronosalvus amylolyticus]|uniref:Ig-like domain-containing protein n=1 Tax=Natronosalvus amylolyticus TaxID=2961994 RepID=UPI0020C95BE9|nr:Ig-like domain-containing protein [Natronosalvus amylolyticus]
MIRRGEERAVSTIIGAVLILGILVTALALYQVNVVPDDNRAVEYEHHQGVQSQLLDVRNGLVNAPDRRVGSYSVALGTTYPTRTFTINPPPSSGTLETVGENRTIRLENVEVEGGDVGDYWNERELEFNTSSLVYQPRYNEYRNAPTIVYENSVLYNEQNGGQAALSGQRLIDGNTIQLVLLEGEYSSSQSGTVAVDFETVSASSNTIDLEANGNVTLSISSHLSQKRWEQLLSDEPRVQSVTNTSDGVEITLEEDDYTLQVAKVGLGSNIEDEKDQPAYLTVVEEPREVQEGETTRMTVEVRDGYNNPVSGVRVNGSVNDDAANEMVPDNDTTGSNGQVTFSYETGEDEGGNDVYLNASFKTEDPSSSEFDSDDPESVSRMITVRQSSSGNGGGSSDEGAFSGRIQDTDTGDRVLIKGDGLYRTVEIEDSNGNYTVYGVQEDDYENVVAGDYEKETDPFTVEPQATTSTVDFGDPPFFAVSNVDANDADAGETVTVTATVENTGFRTGEQLIELEIEDEDGDTKTVDSEPVNLSEDESKQVTLEWTTEAGDEGEYTANVSSDDDSDTDTLEVWDPDVEQGFLVSIDTTNEPVVEGDTLLVNSTVTNDGNETDTQDIVLKIDGEEKDRVLNEEIPGGESTEVTHEWVTEEGDAGDYTATVSSDNNSDSQQVTIEEYSLDISYEEDPTREGSRGVEFSIRNAGATADIDRILVEDINRNTYDLEIEEGVLVQRSDLNVSVIENHDSYTIMSGDVIAYELQFGGTGNVGGQQLTITLYTESGDEIELGTVTVS